MDIAERLEEALMGTLDWHKVKPGELVLVIDRWQDFGDGRMFQGILMRSLELLSASTQDIAEESGVQSARLSEFLRAAKKPSYGMAIDVLRTLRSRLILAFADAWNANLSTVTDPDPPPQDPDRRPAARPRQYDKPHYRH